MGKALSGELSCPCDRSCYSDFHKTFRILTLIIFYGRHAQTASAIHMFYMALFVNLWSNLVATNLHPFFVRFS